MKYVVKIPSGAIIFKPSFIQIGSDVRKFIWGRGTLTQRQHEYHIDIHSFLIRDVS
jgi:hypothetical protein